MTKPAEETKQAIPSPEDRVRALCDWLKFEARDRTNEAKGRRSTADVMRKATEEQLCAAKRTAERMHGHKLPNVSTDRKSAKLSADMDDRIAAKLEAQAQQLSAWASLVEELIPFCDSPCGHTSQYACSEDGGKNIVCLICEREELKWQVASAKEDAESWKHHWQMYRDAWVRELGGWLVPKSHEIDSLVLTTRKRCVNPLLGNCSAPHWLEKPTADGKALQQTPHPHENGCRDWKVDDSRA